MARQKKVHPADEWELLVANTARGLSDDEVRARLGWNKTKLFMVRQYGKLTTEAFAVMRALPTKRANKNLWSELGYLSPDDQHDMLARRAAGEFGSDEAAYHAAVAVRHAGMSGA